MARDAIARDAADTGLFGFGGAPPEIVLNGRRGSLLDQFTAIVSCVVQKLEESVLVADVGVLFPASAVYSGVSGIFLDPKDVN